MNHENPNDYIGTKEIKQGKLVFFFFFFSFDQTISIDANLLYYYRKKSTLNEDRNTMWVEGSRDDSIMEAPEESRPLRCGKYTVFMHQYWQNFTSADHPTKTMSSLNEGGFG